MIGPTRMTRDVRIIHRQLQAQGRAVWLGEPFPKGPPPTPLDDVPRAVAGVKALFEESVGAQYRAACAAPDPAGARLDPQTEAAALRPVRRLRWIACHCRARGKLLSLALEQLYPDDDRHWRSRLHQMLLAAAKLGQTTAGTTSPARPNWSS